jgi:hypothetical protein
VFKVSSDLELLITERLRAKYATSCTDVVGIFGYKILPRIRQTLGPAEFQELGREEKVDWCVYEYMNDRKGYDRQSGETECSSRATSGTTSIAWSITPTASASISTRMKR